MNRYTWRTLLLEVVMIALAIVFISPFFILVSTALRPMTANGSDAASGITLDNIATAWETGGLGPALWNSLLVTTVSSVAIVLLSSLASYQLARARARLAKGVFALFMAGLLLPLQLATLPLYVFVRDIGLLGSIWGLVIVYCGTFLPFSIFLYTMFIRSIPAEYEEAAQIDGAGHLRTFTSVIFPLVRPITATIVILNGISIYNDFFTPLLYLSGTGEATAPVAINSFVSQYNTQWPVVFGGLLVAAVPALIVYFVLQRQIIQGFAGGLKG